MTSHDPFSLPLFILGNAFVAIYVAIIAVTRKADRVLLIWVACLCIAVNGHYIADLYRQPLTWWTALLVVSGLTILDRIRKRGSL